MRTLRLAGIRAEAETWRESAQISLSYASQVMKRVTINASTWYPYGAEALGDSFSLIDVGSASLPPSFFFSFLVTM